MSRPTQLALAVLLAVSGTQAHAQLKNGDRAVVPIINQSSGKVESMLVLEPTGKTTGTRWRFGSRTLDNAFGLSAGQSLALLCNGNAQTRMDRLSDNCALGAIGPSASVSRGNTRVGVSLGKGQSVPGWMLAGSGKARVDESDLALFAEYNIGKSGVVSIAGTTAKAHLVSAADNPGLADQWNTRMLSLGGGVGAFRASVFGRVVEVPGQPWNGFEGFGVGLSWRTPWSGQLSVGAENVNTRGKNPFAPSKMQTEEGTVPYVRYEQDL